MNRLISLVCGGVVLGASVLAGALPAAAQPGGPCGLVSDDALSAALGQPVHAIGMLSNGSAVGGGPAVADMCIAPLGGQNAIMITHVVGVQTPGDLSGTPSLPQGGAGSLAGLAAVDPSLLTVTQLSGLGDAAVLMTGNPNGQLYGNLMVWRGGESFSIVGTGLTDLQTSLPGVAQALLANAAPTQ
jgi:hypothetical protein